MANVTPMQMYIDHSELITEIADDETQSREEITNCLIEALGGQYSDFIFRKKQKIATGVYHSKSGKSIYIMVANITFMGGTEGQHPLDLKRIQYNVVWREFYEQYSPLGEVLWMGIYSYKNTRVWGIFHPETYLAKHVGSNMISKGGFKAQYSCHIFLNDLYEGYSEGYFSKIDKQKNHVEAINFELLKNRFEGVERKTNPIIEVIDNINKNYIPWNRWLTASEAIPYMRELKEKNNFGQWKQNMWNGWYVEAIYSEYLTDNPSPFIDYIATSKNQRVKDEYKDKGLDLAFPHPGYHFIGDLKAVCVGTGDTLLNDEETILEDLKQYKRIWFVIYIHDKQQGSTNDYEMVKWRNHYILDNGEWDFKRKKVFDELDAYKTPHSISFSEMIVIELNEITKDAYFSVGEQFGLNSDGNERNEKFKINKRLFDSLTDDSFVIYRYQP